LDADGIDQVQGSETGSKVGVVAVGGIGQDKAARQARRTGRADLIEGDLRLGLKGNVRRDASLDPALGIPGPCLGQIQAPGHRQAGVIVGQRQRHRDLAVIPLAELAAVLTRHPDRVAPLLGDPGIVHDPGRDRAVALKCRHDVSVDRFQQSGITPRGLGNEVMQ
jgi:hypothetical protein